MVSHLMNPCHAEGMWLGDPFLSLPTLMIYQNLEVPKWILTSFDEGISVKSGRLNHLWIFIIRLIIDSLADIHSS